MQTLITVIHIVTCLFLVLVVLMQSGKGAEISATLGGSSQTVFGSTGGANFFQKLTYGLAAVFFVTSLLLTIASGRNQKSVFDSVPASAGAPAGAASAPVAPPAGTTTTAPATTTAPTGTAAGTKAQ